MDQGISALLVASLTSLSALLGVLIANRFNSQENQKRLDFEIKDRRNQRLQDLRKEVYLKAAADLVSLNSILSSSISNPDRRRDMSLIEEAFANLNKLNVVSSSHISIQVAKVTQEYGVAVMSLMQSYPDLYQFESELKVQIDYINKNLEELDGCIIKMNLANAGGDISQDEKNELEIKHNTCNEIHERMLQKHDQVKSKLQSKRIDTIKVMIGHMKTIQPEVNNLINLLREEMDLEPINLTELYATEKIKPEDIVERMMSLK